MRNYTYRGYEIISAKHPTPFDPQRTTWDVVDGDRVRRGNIASIETAKRLIDTMVKYGYWPERGVIG